MDGLERKECQKRYYADNKERIKETQQKWREAHREYLNAKQKDYVRKNYDAVNSQRRKTWAKNKEKYNILRRDRLRKIKKQIWQHYFNGVPKCQKCNTEYDIRLLEMHHTNGDGGAHKKEMGMKHGSGGYYIKLLNAGFPALDVQSLCPNCHGLIHLDD